MLWFTHVTKIRFFSSFSLMYMHQKFSFVVLFFSLQKYLYFLKNFPWYSKKLFTFVGYVKYQRCYEFCMSHNFVIVLISCSWNGTVKSQMSFYFFWKLTDQGNVLTFSFFPCVFVTSRRDRLLLLFMQPIANSKLLTSAFTNFFWLFCSHIQTFPGTS